MNTLPNTLIIHLKRYTCLLSLSLSLVKHFLTPASLITDSTIMHFNGVLIREVLHTFPHLPLSLTHCLSHTLCLSRFVYHGTTGSKVDTPVSFPLVLDPHLVSHDCHMTDSLELVACVCHFGCKLTELFTEHLHTA